MESTESFNFSSVSEMKSYPASPFPAWAPSVTVAVGMLAFLAGSFYLRHRKVVKKREILMDYFYVIFQYGGMRRKRMVTALCNTNAITLRQLGKSFMISCDSMDNGDSSCPFYLDDSPFPNRYSPQPQPVVNKKTAFFRSRGISITKRYRGPFQRFKSQQSQDNPHAYPLTFQDIVMKFRTKRPHNHQTESKLKRPHTPSRQFEGSSMCTIHGDDYDYQSCIEEDDRESPALNNKHRRNAFTSQNDIYAPRFSEVAKEEGRHSLSNTLSESMRAQQSAYSGKRNSEPWYNLQAMTENPSQTNNQQPGVFHVYGNLLSPSNVVCGSQGYIPSAHERGPSFQSYRNSEPTILVHTPSVDVNSTHGWSDIRSKHTNGVVILKRVPNPDAGPGEFCYGQQNTQTQDNSDRASLSKVSYVPSGNMNSYCNSFLSNNKEKKKKDDSPGHKSSKTKTTPSKSGHGASRSKRFRLGLGSLAVSSFNRRIDMASQDYESDQSTDKKSSKDSSPQQKHAHKTTWMRFKNVFSGSRTSQSVQSEDKNIKSQLSTHVSMEKSQNSTQVSTEEEPKKSCRDNTRWQKFVSVFTGFRSLPESKKLDALIDYPKISNSCPMGLNQIIDDEKFNASKFKYEFAPKNITNFQNLEPLIHTVSSITNPLHINKCKPDADRGGYIPDLREQQRPVDLQIQSNTHTLSTEFVDGNGNCHHFRTMITPASIGTHGDLFSRSRGRHVRKLHYNGVVPSVMQSRKQFKSYSFEAGCFMSPEEYRLRRCAELAEGKYRVETPDRLEGNENGYDFSFSNRRFRSLSPLPEVNYAGQHKEDVCPVELNLASVPAQSVYFTPLDNDRLRPGFDASVKSDTDLLHKVDYIQQRPSIAHDSLDITSEDTPLLNFTSSTQTSIESDLEKETNKSPERIKRTDYFQTNNSSISLATETSELSLLIESSDDFKNKSDNKFQTLASYLTLEHWRTGLSNDSLYYDTVSAIGSPSSSEPKDLLNIRTSPSLPSISRQLKNVCCIHASNSSGIPKLEETCSGCSIVLNSDVLYPPVASNPYTTTSISEPLSPRRSSVTSLPYEFLFCSENESCISQTSHQFSPIHFQREDHSATTFPGTEELRKSSEILSGMDSACCLLTQESETKTIGTNNSIIGRRLSQNLSIPSGNAYSYENRNSSCDSSPFSSRPTTPSRRHSTPSPSPERSQSRLSGYGSIDEIYMANVARLPRFCQRVNQNSPVSKGAVDSLC